MVESINNHLTIGCLFAACAAFGAYGQPTVDGAGVRICDDAAPHAQCGATGRTTFANPLDLEYRMRPESDADFREAADPEIATRAGCYWLFASKCGGYYVSDNLTDWRFVFAPGLPLEEYAPTVEEIGGKFHFTARGGTVDREIDAASGAWQRIGGRMAHTCDSALFRDGDGRLYVYWATDFEGRSPIRGCELDPATFADCSPEAKLMDEATARCGWEIRGDANDQTNSPSYIEGPHMFAHGGRYYLQYASPGTEYAGYCDGALVGRSPLGPFARQRTNPFSFKPTGYIAGAGHGKTFADRYGNVWHVTTGVIRGVERRIVLFPVFFDADGEMWCDTAFADWPIRVPDRRVSSPEEYRTGWMELTVGKCATVTSSSTGSDPVAALDRDIRTFWSAATGRPGESFAVDLGGRATVRAIQVGFADAGDIRAKGAARFRIEGSADGASWRVLVDASCNTREAEHPYFELAQPAEVRHLRVVNLFQPRGKRFALRELRAFGSMDVPRPGAVCRFRVWRDPDDRRHAVLAWEPVSGATGYLVRYGVAADKLHLSCVTRKTSAEMRSLDAGEDYVWSVSAFNEAGFSSETIVKRP